MNMPPRPGEESPGRTPFKPDACHWLAQLFLGPAGLRAGERIETAPGVKGHVVWGPYRPMAPGSYRVLFRLAVDEPQLPAGVPPGSEKRAVFLDVVSGQGEFLFGSLEIEEAKLKSGDYYVTFEITAQDDDQMRAGAMEARVWTSGKCRFALTAVDLERVVEVSPGEARNLAIADERARGRYCGFHFRKQDKFWVQTLEFAKKHANPGTLVVAPPQFLVPFPKSIPYQLLNEDSLTNAELLLILHKGMSAEIGLKMLKQVRQKLTPVFANKVFVILSNNAAVPKSEFESAHVDALWAAIDELERTSPSPPAERNTPNYAALITTYNRPWALARSLPQVVNLGCPVVVVDDGSDAKFHADYRIIRDRFPQPRVSWITLPENRGVSCAINMGLSYLSADPSIDWISYFQDDVDVHPDLFEYLGKVQHRVERPLLTGRHPPAHPVVGEADINGIHVLSLLSAPGQHLHAHRDYWLGVMPLPSFKVGLPKPKLGSGCDWWIGSWSPNSVCKRGMHIICVPQLVSAFANKPEESTWGNNPVADDGLLPAKSARPLISFCTTCANRLYQFRQTFAANLKIIQENPDTEWIILNFNSKDDLHEFMLEQRPVLPPCVIYARDLSNHPWHAAVAINVAHRLARGNILVNLDCDNFIGEMVDVIRAEFTSDIQAIHFWSGTYKDGTCGRIAISRDAFYRLGGYDESFHPMGYQDLDLLERARAQGGKILHIPSPKDSAIWNDKQESIKHCNGGIADWTTMNFENKSKSKLNIADHRLVANEGKDWGRSDFEIFPGEGKSSSWGGIDSYRKIKLIRNHAGD